MRYVRVQWVHSSASDPIEILAELDESGREVRVLERFHDGRVGRASHEEETALTQIVQAPWPPLSELSEDGDLWSTEISQGEFEQQWASVP